MELGIMLVLLALGIAAGYWLAKVLGAAERRRLEAEHRQEVVAQEAQSALALQKVERLGGELQQAQIAVERAEKQASQDRAAKIDLQEQMLPMRTALEQLDKQIHDAENRRQKAQGELQEQVRSVGDRITDSTKAMGLEVKAAAKDVRQEAQRLNSALSSSGRRGSWGEMRLQQIVESAGMVEHVHYVTQDSQSGDGSAIRPDMVVDLAGGRKIVVDSKVSLDSFLHLSDDATEQDYQAAVAQHAQAVVKHVKTLSNKKYWEHYDTPEMVVMFLPAESLLSLALQEQPALLKQAFEARVVPATPTTLLAILNTASYAWQQDTIARNARDIMALATELHSRLRTMGDHFTQLGSRIQATVDTYNKTVGSLERRVMPGARKVAELVNAEGWEPEEITAAPRPLSPGNWDVVEQDDEEQVVRELANRTRKDEGDADRLGRSA